MARHTLSHSVDLYSGEAVMNGWLGSNRGLPIDLLILDDLGAPEVADINAIALSGTSGNQATADLANFVLDGVKTSGGVVTLDVARCIQIVSSGADTSVANVVGTDKFGNALTEAITFNGNTPVIGVKAFKKITQISVSGGSMSNNADIGTSDKIGLTYRVDNFADLVAVYEDGVLRTSKVAATASAAAARTAAESLTVTAAATENVSAIARLVTYTSNDPSPANPQTINDGNAVSDAEITIALLGLETFTIETAVDLLDHKVAIDQAVVDLLDLKVNYDKVIIDVEAMRVELNKLVTDADVATVGSFVVGDGATATNTTKDVRGSYDPVQANDGTRTLKLLIRPKARTSIGAYGVAQL